MKNNRIDDKHWTYVGLIKESDQIIVLRSIIKFFDIFSPHLIEINKIWFTRKNITI